jgi:hypothetical protein
MSQLRNHSPAEYRPAGGDTATGRNNEPNSVKVNTKIRTRRRDSERRHGRTFETMEPSHS